MSLLVHLKHAGTHKNILGHVCNLCYWFCIG